MAAVIGCMAHQHNPWLVLLAALICGAGSWALVRLFLRAAHPEQDRKPAWIALASGVTAASIWCTHFVAMLGYEPSMAIGIDPVLTIVSLVVAMAGSGIGFLAATENHPAAAAIGGAAVGLSIAVMHHIGMLAYRVLEVVAWDRAFLAASILVCCALSALALHIAIRGRSGWVRSCCPPLLFFLAIFGLHVAGMTAFEIAPFRATASFPGLGPMQTLALALSCVGTFIVGIGFACGFIDTTARATAADALANTSNGLTMISPGGKVTLVNNRVCRLFHLPDGELRSGMSLEDYVAVIGRNIGWDDARIDRVTANHRHWMSLDSTTQVEHHFDDGKILSIACQPVGRGGAILTYEDVTEARDGQRTIAFMAFHDSLTGLKNRRMFAKRIEELFTEGGATMLMIDLDRFKGFNDRHGHAAGDELLRQVAARLEDLLLPGEEAFRLGGDELAVLSASTLHRAKALARAIVRAFAEPFRLEPYAGAIGCSIGIAVSTERDDAPILRRKADMALIGAKCAGLGRIEVYKEGMLEAEAKKRALEHDLSAAIAAGELELWYQPLYRLPGLRLAGFEALVRWRHPERGLVPPGEFIPLAEASGLIHSLGAWIFDTACRQVALWPDDLYVSINVSAVQLRSPALATEFAGALTRHGLAASRVEIEITETAIVEHDGEVAEVLAALRTLGLRVAMDDFGTGYSSLTHLREFEIDRIKIDRSFVAAASQDPGAATIVRAVLSMARELGIDTTAEGIETDEQLRSLCDLGCGTVQGYLFSRPLESLAADLLILSEEKKTRPKSAGART